jgi:hypothetical protein
MQLCSLYKLPTLAVKTLLHMRKYKIDINNITYSYYNKAIIEGDWPTSDRWGKLRLYINIIKAFKSALKERKERLAKLKNEKRKYIGTKRNKKKKSLKNKISNQTLKSNGLSSVNECSNKTSTVTLKPPNGHVSSSSRSQSITCSLSSITDTQDKISIDIDKISADSGAYLNGNSTDHKKGLSSASSFFY